VLTGQGLSSDQSRVIHGAWPQYLTAALADFVKRCSDHNERTKRCLSWNGRLLHRWCKRAGEGSSLGIVGVNRKAKVSYEL